MDILLKKELKTIMREKKSLLSIILYLGVICAMISAIFLFQGVNSNEYSFYPKAVSNIYNSFIVTQFTLICILIPIISYFSIKNDFFNNKLEIIKFTKVSIFHYVFTKSLAVNIYFILLYLTTIPVGIIMVFFGGCTIKFYIYYSVFSLTTSFLVSSLAILCTIIFNGKFLGILVYYLIIIFLSVFGFISNYINIGVDIIKKVYKFISPIYGLNLYLDNNYLNELFGDINNNILLFDNKIFYIIEYLCVASILIVISSILYKRKCE
jgi:hypothetical protein